MLEPLSDWVVEFDAFSVDLAARDLKRDGRRVPLQELPFRLLAALLEHPGQTVSREELRARLWGGTVVDFEDGLHTAVRKLRGVLGDSTAEPRYIQTIPRRGYCFIAPVVRHRKNGGEPADDAGAGAAAVPSTARRMPLRIWLTATVALMAISVLAAFEVVRLESGTVAPAQVVPIATDRGTERSPSLSPDGNRVVFSWTGESGQVSNLYVQGIDGSGRRRLTNSPAADSDPQWSPDGRSIAFVRDNHLMTIPAQGGAERNLTTAVDYGLAWSPDSKTIAICDKAAPGELNAIYLVSADTGARRKLLESSAMRLEDVTPAFSPDGKYIAFARKVTTATDIYVVPVAGGNPRRVARPGRPLSSLVWSPDGSRLVFSGGETGLFTAPAGESDSARIRRLDIAGLDVHQISVVRRPDNREIELAYGHEASNWDILGATIAGKGVTPRPLAASTRADQAPRFSPDGKRLAFASARSGFEEIWVAASDGSGPVQLTHFNSGLAGSPNWSTDGRWIVFDATVNDNRDIYAVSSAGGPVRRLTSETSAEGEPSWSRDGKWIYFMSDRLGSRQIWKMPSVGGQAVQVTEGGGYEALESPDGKTLYYARLQTGGGVWSVPVNGGAETLVSGVAQHRLWSIADDGMYFFDLTGLMPQVFSTAQPCSLKKYDFATRRVSTVATIVTDLPNNLPAFGITRDGKEVAWVSRRDHFSELMLIRNLHY
jgi:Tol biopolymer transport system component/DNA-binding winged helix-turn-helix (wHTH) protein